MPLSPLHEEQQAPMLLQGMYLSAQSIEPEPTDLCSLHFPFPKHATYDNINMKTMWKIVSSGKGGRKVEWSGGADVGKKIKREKEEENRSKGTWDSNIHYYNL